MSENKDEQKLITINGNPGNPTGEAGKQSRTADGGGKGR